MSHSAQPKAALSALEKEFPLEPRALRQRRLENIAFPRQIAMFLSRELTGNSLQTIGEAFGGRDHGTVIYACRSVQDRMEVDANVRQAVDFLDKQFQR
jgi:chromosomal replication initiator protein